MENLKVDLKFKGWIFWENNMEIKSGFKYKVWNFWVVKFLRFYIRGK